MNAKSTPELDIDKIVNDIVKEINSQNIDKDRLCVGVTDQSEDLVKWKYAPVKRVVLFRECMSSAEAESFYRKLVDTKLQDLGFDDLYHIMDGVRPNCVNVFILEHLK